MRRIDRSSELKAKARLVLAILVLATARVHAQERELRRRARRGRLVSLPDRKLALIEDGQVKKVYSVAVGKDSTPSPTGAFKIVNRVSNPTYYHKGQVDSAGTAKPDRQPLDRLKQRVMAFTAPTLRGRTAKRRRTGASASARKDLEELFAMVRPGDVVKSARNGTRNSGGVRQLEPVVVATATVENGTSVATR